MKFVAIIILLTICSVFSTFAQNDKPLILKKLQQKDSGQVKIVQDKRITDMMFKYASYCESKGTIRGFQILIFSDGSSESRRLINEAKAKFLGQFPEIETNVEVNAVNWNLFVGNYRTITDAYRAKKQFQKYFNEPIIFEKDIDVTKF